MQLLKHHFTTVFLIKQGPGKRLGYQWYCYSLDEKGIHRFDVRELREYNKNKDTLLHQLDELCQGKKLKYPKKGDELLDRSYHKQVIKMALETGEMVTFRDMQTTHKKCYNY